MTDDGAGNDELVRVFVDLSEAVEEDWPPTTGEWLWAAPTSDGYRIDNIPMFARNISYNDVVSAYAGDEESLQFRERVACGGHSTVRVILSDGGRLEDGKALDYWRKLSDLGCSYEGHSQYPLYAIDIPPTKYHAAWLVIDEATRAGVWDYETGDIQG